MSPMISCSDVHSRELELSYSCSFEVKPDADESTVISTAQRKLNTQLASDLLACFDSSTGRKERHQRGRKEKSGSGGDDNRKDDGGNSREHRTRRRRRHEGRMGFWGNNDNVIRNADRDKEEDIGVVAVSAIPGNDLSTHGVCSALMDESNSCTVIRSTTMLYLNGEAENNVVLETSRSKIMSYMAHDSLIRLVPGLVHAAYLGPFADEGESDVSRNGDNSTVAVSDSSGSSAAGGENDDETHSLEDGLHLSLGQFIALVVCVVVAVAILAFLSLMRCQWRGRKKKGGRLYQASGDEVVQDAHQVHVHEDAVNPKPTTLSLPLDVPQRRGSDDDNSASDESDDFVDSDSVIEEEDCSSVGSSRLSVILEVDEQSSSACPSIIMSESGCTDDTEDENMSTIHVEDDITYTSLQEGGENTGTMPKRSSGLSVKGPKHINRTSSDKIGYLTGVERRRRHVLNQQRAFMQKRQTGQRTSPPMQAEGTANSNENSRNCILDGGEVYGEC